MNEHKMKQWCEHSQNKGSKHTIKKTNFDTDATINESINWIMVTLYGDYELTVDQYNELLDTVTALVEKWNKVK